ncbi:MAG: biotin--[acetyl-CoA-carboxylase] ligase [Flavisolibacter sp.]
MTNDTESLIILDSVDSTNNYAMGLVHAGMAQHGTAIFTDEQKKGKGQFNKSWVSEKNKNIALSLILQPDTISLKDRFIVSMMVAVATFEFMNQYAPEDLTIKWPNDIYWRDRKAGGILIENVVQGGAWKYAIAGIGLNINQTSFLNMEDRAVSLKQISGKTYNPLQLAQELCLFLQMGYEKLLLNPLNIIEQYKKSLYKMNQKTQFKKDNRIFSAVVKSVTSEGLLVLEHAIEEEFRVGEIEWII